MISKVFCTVLFLSTFSFHLSAPHSSLPFEPSASSSKFINMVSLTLQHVVKPSSMVQWSSKKQGSESLDEISKLPPPGGTVQQVWILQIVHVWTRIVIDSLKDFDVAWFGYVFYYNYEDIVGANNKAFSKLLLVQLNSKLRDEFFVEGILVEKGSVKISYNVTKLPFAKSTPFVNGTRTLLLSKRDILSSSPQQRSPKKLSKIKESSVSLGETRLAVSFKINAKYPDVAAGQEEQFLRRLLQQLALGMRVPLSSIKELSIKHDSTVTFVLVITNDSNNLMDLRSLDDAFVHLKTQIRNNRFRLTDLEGRLILPDNGDVVDPVGTAHETSKLPYVVLGLLACVLIMMSVLIFLTAMLLRQQLSKNTKRQSKSRSKVYCDTAIQETGRDSILSMSGRYSYDSGLWLGPGPEPSFQAPDLTYYRPPTREQLVSTPRPTTAVRARLKKTWNIDAEQTLPPIPDGTEQFWNDDISKQKHRYVSEPT